MGRWAGGGVRASELEVGWASGGRAANQAGVHQVDNAPTLGSGQQATDFAPAVPWSGAVAGAKSVDLAAGVQALVDRPGWGTGNALTVRIEGERGSSAYAEVTGSVWPHVEEAIVDRILQNNSTIVFANSRRLAERLTGRLNEIYSERALRRA